MVIRRLRNRAPSTDTRARCLPSRTVAVSGGEAVLRQDQLTLIEVVADAFHDYDAWPLFDYVESVLDHRFGLDFHLVMEDMPPSMVWPRTGYGPQSPIQASVPALALAQSAHDDLERFFRLVQLAVEAEFN